MTNLLIDTEKKYYILCRILLDRVALKDARNLNLVRNYIYHLDVLPISERTLHIIKLLENYESNIDSKELTTLLEKNKITRNTQKTINNLLKMI